jgi:hypothetical protein
MTPLRDTIALAVAIVGVLLLAATPTQTVTAQQQKPPASLRDLCADDIARFCGDATEPQKVKACMQGNTRHLKPDCRSALQTAGILSK